METLVVLYYLGIAFLTVVWILFPILVLRRLDRIVRHLGNIEASVSATALNTGSPEEKAARAPRYKIPGLND